MFEAEGVRRGHRQGPKTFLEVDLAVSSGRPGEEAVPFLELLGLGRDVGERGALVLGLSLARGRRERMVPLGLSLTTKWRREWV